MKKYLLASTAIVATGMIVAAPSAQAAEKIQVKLGGYMEQWFGYGDNDNGDIQEWNVLSDSEIFFLGSTQLDNGVKVGFNVQLEGNTGGEGAQGNPDTIDESYAFVEGKFGRIDFGSENSVMYKMAYSPPDVGAGINSGDQTAWIAESTTSSVFRSAFGSTNIEVNPGDNDSQRLSYYTPRISGFQFGVSYAPDISSGGDDNSQGDKTTEITNIFNVGVNYRNKIGDVDLGVSGTWGTADGPTGSDDPQAFSVGATLGVGGFKVGASYASQYQQPTTNARSIGYALGASYTVDRVGVSLNYFHGSGSSGQAIESRNKHNTIAGSVSYALGPGVSLAGTIAHTEWKGATSTNTSADNKGMWAVVGLRLSF
jgi:predicted porin